MIGRRAGVARSSERGGTLAHRRPASAGGAAPEIRLLGRASSLGLVGQVSSSVLAFAFSLAVSRLFKAHGAGVFFEAVALFTIASSVAQLGADLGLNRTIPRMRVAGRSADILRLLPVSLVPVLVVSAGFAVVLVHWAPVFAGWVAHGSGVSSVASFIRILAPFVPVAALVPVLTMGTRGFDRVWPLVWFPSVGVPVARLVLLPVLLGAGIGFVSVAYAWAVPLILGAMALCWALSAMAHRHHLETGAQAARPTPWRALAREFWIFTAPRALGSTFTVVVVWLDVLLVGGILSPREAGIYAVASRYISIPSYVLGASGGTIGPQTSRLLAEGRPEDLRRLYQISTSWIAATAWPIALVLGIFSPTVMGLFGHEFTAGATALSILAFSMLALTMTGNNAMILIMAGRSTSSLVITGLAMVVNVAANLVLIPHLGINGAAIAWALSLALNTALTSAVLYRDYRLHPVGPSFSRVATAALVCVGLTSLLARIVLGSTWLALFAAVVVGGGWYAWAMWRGRHDLDLGAVVRDGRRSTRRHRPR